jgi:4-aminobutyrate aminotransferase-like enzyme
MVGAEFRTEGRKPDKTLAKEITKRCLERNLMLLTCGPWDNTIRFIPPLNVTEDQIDRAVEIVDEAIDQAI